MLGRRIQWLHDVTLHWLALSRKANRFLKGSQVESTLNRQEHRARTGAGFIWVETDVHPCVYVQHLCMLGRVLLLLKASVWLMRLQVCSQIPPRATIRVPGGPLAAGAVSCCMCSREKQEGNTASWKKKKKTGYPCAWVCVWVCVRTEGLHAANQCTCTNREGESRYGEASLAWLMHVAIRSPTHITAWAMRARCVHSENYGKLGGPSCYWLFTCCPLPAAAALSPGSGGDGSRVRLTYAVSNLTFNVVLG